MLISIITASYNYEKYISETINSVINQTYKDWELIIIDDCSTDNSVEIIKSYCEKDSRIKLFQNDKNLGLKNTLLKGIEKTNGEWIAFLESDDLWKENCLEKRVEIINKNIDTELGLIFNDVECFGDEKVYSKYIKKYKKNNVRLSKFKYPKNIFKEFNVDNRILTFSSVMIKKEYLKPEYFNSPVDKLLDWWLYIHITQNCKCFYITEKLTMWRKHDTSYISKPSNKKFCLLSVEAYWDIYKQNNNDIKLFWFIIFSILLNSKVRMIQIIRKIKQKLGLPLKKSPIFD